MTGDNYSDGMDRSTCPNCSGILSTVRDSYAFYPRGFCYQCNGCGVKIHPDNADTTPKEFCGLFGHETKLLNRLNPLKATVCVRCEQSLHTDTEQGDR